MISSCTTTAPLSARTSQYNYGDIKIHWEKMRGESYLIAQTSPKMLSLHSDLLVLRCRNFLHSSFCIFPYHFLFLFFFPISSFITFYSSFHHFFSILLLRISPFFLFFILFSLFSLAPWLFVIF